MGYISDKRKLKDMRDMRNMRDMEMQSGPIVMLYSCLSVTLIFNIYTQHLHHIIIISYHMSTLLTINTAVGVPSLMENVSLNQPHLSRIFPLVTLDAASLSQNSDGCLDKSELESWH